MYILAFWIGLQLVDLGLADQVCSMVNVMERDHGSTVNFITAREEERDWRLQRPIPLVAPATTMERPVSWLGSRREGGRCLVNSFWLTVSLTISHTPLTQALLSIFFASTSLSISLSLWSLQTAWPDAFTELFFQTCLTSCHGQSGCRNRGGAGGSSHCNLFPFTAMKLAPSSNLESRSIGCCKESRSVICSFFWCAPGFLHFMFSILPLKRTFPVISATDISVSSFLAYLEWYKS